jgi:hypothetical protein
VSDPVKLNVAVELPSTAAGWAVMVVPGAVVSTTTGATGLAPEVFPAASVAVAVSG